MVSKYFEKNSLLKTEKSIWRKTNTYIIEKVKIKSHLKAPRHQRAVQMCVCVYMCAYWHICMYITL